MRNVKSRLAAGFACALLLSCWAAEAFAQGYRVNVYNPGNYSRTRQTMSNRAALRAALKRKQQRQRARRKALRRTVN
jgi:NAD(P)-dependent dehydrogenase (short-subunit alcohol dehydrogenase family)